MIRIGQIKIKHDENFSLEGAGIKSVLGKRAAKALRISPEQIQTLEIMKHSIDARKKPELFHIFTIDVTVKGKPEEALVKAARDKNITCVKYEGYDFWKHVKGDSEPVDVSLLSGKKIVIVGSGPAGLFCGYELAMHGFKPLILERGADVDKRTQIVEEFWQKGQLNPATNVQFGEGGAGTFSDGKLNTMVKDKEGRGSQALDIFVKYGAPERIKYESKPHIGTDILRDVIRNIRESIKAAGGNIFFETQVKDLVPDENGNIKKVVTYNAEYECDACIIAIGHSARDTFGMLKERKVEMQTKPFAVGFRVEHPQSLINLSQYGFEDAKGLGAAPYKLTTTTGSGRGVYSFCMCPGGYVVNASSEEGMLAVNGMSYSGRDGLNANSAIIITVDPADFGGDDVLSGVEFQRRLEKKAYELAGGKIPVEHYGDFRKGLGKGDDDSSFAKMIPEGFEPQMKGGYEFAAVHEILPKDLNDAFVEGMENFGMIIKGYNDARAIVSGVESRTSSPVRILRNSEGESVSNGNLFPCGEGAGYAGGIMSAAMDGIRTAEQVAAKLIK